MDDSTDWMTDAEYAAMCQTSAVIGLTARFGAYPEELKTFPRWKRVLNRMLPVGKRWWLSEFAPYIRETGLHKKPEQLKRRWRRKHGLLNTKGHAMKEYANDSREIATKNSPQDHQQQAGSWTWSDYRSGDLDTVRNSEADLILEPLLHAIDLSALDREVVLKVMATLVDANTEGIPDLAASPETYNVESIMIVALHCASSLNRDSLWAVFASQFGTSSFGEKGSTSWPYLLSWIELDLDPYEEESDTVGG